MFILQQRRNLKTRKYEILPRSVGPLRSTFTTLFNITILFYRPIAAPYTSVFLILFNNVKLRPQKTAEQLQISS